MKTYLDCYPCVLSQALKAARFAGLNETDQHTILNKAMKLLLEMTAGTPSPVIGQIIHRMVRDLSGDPDPYAAVKEQTNRQAMKLLPELREQIYRSAEPLETAIRFAIAGNVIDYGAQSKSMDILAEIENAQKMPFGKYHIHQFRQSLTTAKSIMYLGDNTGEIAFDRLLIEVLKDFSPAEITFVVRGCPVLNDATIDDTIQVGLTDIVRVIDNGSDAPATIIEEVNYEVRTLLQNANMIIAKGQGNYETLSHHNLPIYFLLKVKCPVIGEDLGVNTGEYILATNWDITRGYLAEYKV